MIWLHYTALKLHHHHHHHVFTFRSSIYISPFSIVSFFFFFFFRQKIQPHLKTFLQSQNQTNPSRSRSGNTEARRRLRSGSCTSRRRRRRQQRTRRGQSHGSRRQCFYLYSSNSCRQIRVKADQGIIVLCLNFIRDLGIFDESVCMWGWLN